MEIKENSLVWRPDGVWVELKPQNVIGAALHHMAHPSAGMAEVHGWHLSRWEKEPGFAYNYFITLDGQIIEGRGKYRGAHTAGQNDKLIGIGFQGNFEPFLDNKGNPVEYRKEMPDSQYNSGIWLLNYLKTLYPNMKKIDGHKGYTATSCPGRYFPLAEIIAGKPRAIQELPKEIISSWAREAWNKAVQLGINDGIGAKNPVTEEQLMVFFDRLGLLDK